MACDTDVGAMLLTQGRLTEQPGRRRAGAGRAVSGSGRQKRKLGAPPLLGLRFYHSFYRNLGTVR